MGKRGKKSGSTVPWLRGFQTHGVAAGKKSVPSHPHLLLLFLRAVFSAAGSGLLQAGDFAELALPLSAPEVLLLSQLCLLLLSCAFSIWVVCPCHRAELEQTEVYLVITVIKWEIESCGP